MKKYFIVLLFFVSLFMISCQDKIKESTPSDGLLVNETTTKEKQSDLKNLKRTLKKYHVNYTHKISEADFERAYQDLYDRLDTLSSDEFSFEIMKLLAKVGDNATKATLDSSRYANRYYLPFEVNYFSEGYIIYKASKDCQEYIGHKLVKIENTNIDDVVNILKDYYSGDTVARQRYLCVEDIVFWDLLKACGIVNSKSVKITLEYQGTTKEVTVNAYKNSDYKKLEFSKPSPDLISEYNGKYYSFNKIESAIYIQFNVCNSDPDLSVKEFSEQIKTIANPDVFHSIIVDLRNNPGGMQDTIYPLINVLTQYRAKNEKAQVFILTGAGTFGVSVINIFEQLSKIGTVIGSPTGGLNNYYGDKIYYTLPNTRMTISFPEKHFDFYEGKDIAVFRPDIEVIQSYEDYVLGNDTLIKACLNITERVN